MPKYLALQGARFETVDIAKQPNPAAAIDLIAKVPVIKVLENIVACDGGGDKLGHPKIFINLVNSLFSLLLFFRIKNKQFRVLIVVCAINRNNKKLLFYFNYKIK